MIQTSLTDQGAHWLACLQSLKSFFHILDIYQSQMQASLLAPVAQAIDDSWRGGRSQRQQ